MAADSWRSIAAASKPHQNNLQSQFDLYLGFEDVDAGDEESRAEFACPFCSEDFDVLGLCCHIDDEHPVEAKNGVCPACAAHVGMDMVGHITVQHANIYKMHRRRKPRRGSSGTHSTLSLLKKELREGHLQSLLGGSGYTATPSYAVPDPLLSSFIYNLPSSTDSSKDVEPLSLDEPNLGGKIVEQNARKSSEPSLSDKEHKERAQRCEFVQSLVLSTIFRDNL